MKHNQNGSVNVLLIPLIVSIVLLIIAVIFGGSSFNQEKIYKNDYNQKLNAALSIQKQNLTNQLDNSFAQAEKTPLQTYDGPQQYGSIVIQYPKTWSAYIDDTGSGSGAVDAYFDPGYVPALNSQTSIFALRVQVLNSTYSNTLLPYSNNVSQGKDSISPYSLPKLPSVVGVEVTGDLQNGQTGTMVILPLRSQSIEIWTESSQFISDFNTYILPNFSFSP